MAGEAPHAFPPPTGSNICSLYGSECACAWIWFHWGKPDSVIIKDPNPTRPDPFASPVLSQRSPPVPQSPRCSTKKHTIIRHSPPKLAVPKFVKPQQIAASRAASLKLAVRRESFRKAEHGVGEEDGVIIVDHGSRRQQSNLMLSKLSSPCFFVRSFAILVDSLVVEIGRERTQRLMNFSRLLMLPDEFVAMFKARTGYRIVEPAHMELAEPSISDAFRSCVQQGANRDIPSLAAQASKEHSGISYVVSAPLGLHDLLVVCFYCSIVIHFFISIIISLTKQFIRH
ncbi:hypothetical protein ACMD2_26233 [Ananas comosus]|uniref:Sirohydrochlorin ferrochelatase, chloroplastic n=1 Tax=Ananas comosus TaxID=4615 RepID=A0A199UUM1_ANACO|nr:hypothetical protein ACMD2_26233 [Ananas comosus]